MMRNLTKILAGSILATLAFAGAAFAHHSFAMFDVSKQVYLEGTVTSWAFNNPHTWLFIEIETADGEAQVWGFEGSAPVAQLARGITGETFQPGDFVRVAMCPMRDGRHGGHMAFVQLADGSVVTPNDAGCPSGANVARWEENGWFDSLVNFDAVAIPGAPQLRAVETSPTGTLIEVAD